MRTAASPAGKTLASRLKWARKEVCDVSQTSLAKVADVPPRLVGFLEEGSRDNPELKSLNKLAIALHVPMAWLGNGEGPLPDPEGIRAHVLPAVEKLKPKRKGKGKKKPRGKAEAA